MKRIGQTLTLALFSVSLPLTSLAQSYTPIAQWRYLPLDEAFYNSAIANVQTSRIYDAVEAALAQQKKAVGSSEEAEAKIVLAEVCLKIGLKQCAFQYAFLAAKNFPGSKPGLRGLQMIEEIMRSSWFSETQLRQFVNAAAFKEVPESVLSMMNYFVAFDNLEKKLSDWSAKAVKKIGSDNYWAYRWTYLSILEASRREKADATISQLETLAEKTKTEPVLQNEIYWQLARLKFEISDYPTSLKYYDLLNLNGRTAGRILREKAWVHFWNRGYAEALGLIKALKAPFYAESMDPELYLLEMLTLRKLCHFDVVKSVAQEFSQAYRKTIDHIRKRLPLDNERNLLRLSFAKAGIQPEVDTIGRIRDEHQRIQKIDLVKSKKWQTELNQLYTDAEKTLREETEFKLRPDLQKEAARLLGVNEQVQLVDYLSGLDGYRVTNTYEKRNYEAAKGSASSFKDLYWPVVKDEFWNDELKKYSVLVEDKCSQNTKAESK